MNPRTHELGIYSPTKDSRHLITSEANDNSSKKDIATKKTIEAPKNVAKTVNETPLTKL